MSAQTKRKGTTRPADVPADILHALERGEIESATLAEALAIDFNRLLTNTLGVKQAVDAVPPDLGITKRMVLAADYVIATLGADAPEFCVAHSSDTVRGWGAYVATRTANATVKAQLKAIRPYADDAHFAVREWAWLAVRPQLVTQLDDALSQLLPWARNRSPYLRRFASEALRPRGVWCTHIKDLKAEPERAEPLLTLLRADPNRYVQDSVGNWLNDAYKSQPQWVKALCDTWHSDDDNEATRYIIKRALRGAKG